MKGRFLVLEGIDGCGKTSQINHLANWLPKSGLMPKDSRLHITREPGGTELGVLLRNLLLNDSKKNSPTPLTELFLYAADRAQHISQKILPAIQKGDWIVSDRFSGSTIAYQGFGRNLNMSIINQLEEIALQGLYPDITIWLDVGIEESIKRRKEFSNDRIEAEGKEFLTRVASGFSQLAEDRNWIRIDANNHLKKINMDIEAVVKNHFRKELHD
tara:strand:- start:1606 stop:2250 length:645 start_codon:yes stop_codon:yes gene_type:complete